MTDVTATVKTGLPVTEAANGGGLKRIDNGVTDMTDGQIGAEWEALWRRWCDEAATHTSHKPKARR